MNDVKKSLRITTQQVFFLDAVDGVAGRQPKSQARTLVVMDKSECANRPLVESDCYVAEL